MYLRHPRRAISMLISGAVIAASLSTAYVAAAAVQPRVGEPASVYAVIKTITLAPSDTQPYGIAVDPTDDTVYVAHYNGGKVSVINGRTGTWDDTVTVGTSPWGVAVNDADDSVYVTNAGSNSVSIFGGRTPNAVTTVSGVSQPQGVAVDQSDDTVYIPKITGANLAYFNGATPGSVGTLSLGGQPTGVTVNSQDDTVYVTNIGVPDAVWVVNGRTGSLDDTVNVGSNPFWVAVDQTDDTVYTSNATGDSVTVIKGSSRAVTATISLGGGANPEGVAVNPADHKVFVANAGPDYVSVIDGVTGTRTDDTIAVGQQPSGVAVDDSGAFNAGLVYVANRNTGGPGSVSVIGKATPASSPSSGPAGTTVTLTLTVPNLAPGYVMDDSTVKNVYFDGVDVGTVTRGAGNTWTVVAPAGAAGSTAAVTVKLNGARIASAGTFTYNNPTPPPPPVDPPGAPTNVKAEPGYESASVTFDPPASSGTYPISRYRVTSQPGGQVCYVTPPGGAQGGDGGVGGIGGVGPGSAGPRAVDPPSTYAEIKTIRVGTYPGSVAVNNASDKVYVGNRNSNNVSVIDGKTGLRTDDTLTTGTLPTSVAVNQKDDTVYVGNGNSYSLSVFNGKASGPRTADATVPLSPVGRGNGPSAVVVDQRDGTVYVPDYGTSVSPGAVSVLNGSTNAVTRTFPVGVSPMGAALHEASDTLYLTNWVPKNVWAVNARTGARIGEPIGLDGSASGVGVYQADGTVYAASWGTDSVAVIDGTTKAVTHTIPVQRAPQGVAVDQTDNKVFVANTQANSLSVIDGATKTVTHTLRVGMQGSFPYAVAVDGAGTNQGLVYTANYLNNSTSVVAKVTPSVSPARGPAATRATLSLSVPNLSSTFSMDSEAVKYVYLNGIAVGAVTRGTGNTWTFPVPPGRGTVPISVEFRGGLKASAGTFTYQTAPSPLSCTVPNLIPGVEYTFTVEAESQAGWGQRSTPSNPAVPYGPIKSTFTTPGIYECTVAGGVGGTGGTGAAPKAGEPVSIPFTVKGGKGGTGNQGICDGDCFEPIPNPGGFGANVSGSFDAPVGTKLYLTVGSNGRDAGSLDGGEASAGGGGGGYSAISLGADKDPIVVAGGGGGGSYFNALRVGLGSVRAKAPVTRASTPRAGLDWTAQTAPVAGLTGLAYGDGTFVAVNYFVDTQPSVITSPDGITWTARTAPQTSDPSPRTYAWHSVAYGDGTFVAVAGPRYAAPSTPAGVMRSTDRGATWSLVTPPNVDLWSVTYGDGKFVGVTRDGKSIWSDDKGLTWQLGTGVPALRWADVTYGAGRFVAVASTGTGNRVMTSPDGKTWTSRATPADEAWSGLAYGNGMFVAVSATGTNRVMSSPDGITWTLRNAAVANRWMGVTYGDGQFVAVSNGGTLRSLVMTSPDGITWTEGNPTPRAGWQMVAYGSGKFVAVNGAYGGVPQVMTSGSVGPVLPSAPTITETLPDDSRGYIYFRPPANATEAGVTNYEYQLDNGAWVTLSPASTSTTIVITGLTNGQTYSVRVRAVGANGVGEASAPATVTPDAPVEAFGNKGGKADPTATKSGGGNGGNTAGEGEFGGTLTTPGTGGRAASTRPNAGGPGGDGGAPGAAGATATDASGGKGGGGGGGFGAPGGAGSAPNYALIASTWTPLPGAFGGGGGGGFDGGGGGGGYAGGGGGAGGAGSYGAGGGGGGSSLLVTASTAVGITNKVNGALAANSTGGSIEIANVKCGFSITYEGNGNTAGTVPTDSQVYESGSTAVAKDGTGLKKGTQVFVGWATTQSGPVAYVPGARLGPINAPVTLWAVYGAPKTVTFDANQGTGTMAPQSSGSPEALERNTFTRTDYAFTGWNTKADGTGTAYANGATYGFGTDLTLYAQWASAPKPKEEPITEPLGPGEAELQIDGKPQPVVVEPNPITDGLIVVKDDWTMTLEGLGAGGVPLPVNADGVLILQAERDARTTGTGFMPNSLVGLFLDPPVEDTATPAARALKTVALGTVSVDGVGDFSGIKTLPDEIKPGLHVLQAVGYGPAGQRRALSIGILVVPWLELDQGTRKPAGRHDRMSTTGTSGGIDAGSKLTPWIKYNGQGAFKGGKANIRIKADGTFTWTRLIKKSKGLTGYVSWQDVKSNEVYWPKVR